MSPQVKCSKKIAVSCDAAFTPVLEDVDDIEIAFTDHLCRNAPENPPTEQTGEWVGSS